MSDMELPEGVQRYSDLLSRMGDVTCNRIIGGWGFFKDDRQFAIAMKDMLYLHVDDGLRDELKALGSGPFEYSRQGQSVVVERYYGVPSDTVDDEDRFLVWADRSFQSSAIELQGQEHQSSVSGRKALIICTSHDKLGDTGNETGVWLEELVDAYFEFAEAGYSVETASPDGGRIPIDPGSNSDEYKPAKGEEFMECSAADNLLHNARKLSEIQSVGDYDAVLIVGGHGAMWDLRDNDEMGRLLSECLELRKPLGAVCHGVAGLMNMNTKTGKSLVSGRKITGFTNEEEIMIGLNTIVPFLLEDDLEAAEAKFSHGGLLNDYCIVDGTLVTGQNPFSNLSCVKNLICLAANAEQKLMLSSGG